MIKTMMDAETKKLDKCAVLLQSFWRGLLQRRLIQVPPHPLRRPFLRPSCCFPSFLALYAHVQVGCRILGSNLRAWRC
jgi:hypothetical protein